MKPVCFYKNIKPHDLKKNAMQKAFGNIRPVFYNFVRAKTIAFLTVALILPVSLYSQSFTQTIRGTVIDKDSRLSLPGANVVLLNSTPPQGAITDNNGAFRLEKVPVGRQGIQVSFIGYKTVTIENLIVNSAKETVLEIALEEIVTEFKEVTVVANRRKDQTINKMASVSARTFTVEETEKYAGSRGDVARMAMNYAGVSAANDQRNDIIIRGNSPSGLLWRLEDVDIPNPNHFAENGTTGGPVGMLNNNLLVNSDFFTSAFPSEYGNALSGVFDLKMRNGNNEKYEYLFQSGFNGFELGAEGPLSRNHKSSFLANFRYSTLELVDDIINIGTSGIPRYTDFSYKLNFPMEKGRLTVFGLAGKSQISMLDSKENEQDLYTDEGQDLYNFSNMATTGISYAHFLSTKTYLKFSLTGLFQEGGAKIDSLDLKRVPHRSVNHKYAEFRTSLGVMLSSKLNSHISLKSGFTADKMGYDMDSEVFENERQSFKKVIQSKKPLLEGLWLIRAYSQVSWKLNNRLSFNPGIHFLHFDQSENYSVEPRVGFSYNISESQRINAGYGFHSKIQALSTYFLNTRIGETSYIQTNKNLELTKSHQFVLGYDASISQNTRIKFETYYQKLFNVPVEQRPTTFSMLNTGAGWGIDARDSLVNTGAGKNYGVELTLERFFSKNFYYLVTLSLYESKYKGSDGIERNTAFNGNYVLNTLLGYEFKINHKSAITLDYKLTIAGGKRYTPIDLEKSRLEGETKYVESEAFSQQFSPFFKTDIKIGYRLNGKRTSQEWQFFVENFTNHENILMQSYSKSKDKINNINQLGIFPMVLYRIHF